MLPDIQQGLPLICHFGKHGEVALPQSMKCCIVSERNCFFEAKHQHFKDETCVLHKKSVHTAQ
jgi:macrodomain Ter protein organizer (MatP/YcbG family)